MNARVKIKDTTDAVIKYWAQKGYDVSEEGHQIVNGLPASIRKVTSRQGNTKLPNRAYLGDIAEQALGTVSDGEFQEIKRRAKARVMADRRLRELIETLDSAESHTRELSEAETRRLRVNDILAQVSKRTGVSVAELKGQGRARRIARARFEVYFRIREEVGLSLPRIGKIMGDRDHTTIMHGIRRYEQICEEVDCG